MIDKKKLDKYFHALRSYALQLESNGSKCSAKLIFEIADYLKSLKEQPKADKWIPCEERLPSEKGQYLVSTVGFMHTVVDTAYFDSERWHMISKVLAWQPLPQPYKKEGAE